MWQYVSSKLQSVSRIYIRRNLFSVLLNKLNYHHKDLFKIVDNLDFHHQIFTYFLKIQSTLISNTNKIYLLFDNWNFECISFNLMLDMLLNELRISVYKLKTFRPSLIIYLKMILKFKTIFYERKWKKLKKLLKCKTFQFVKLLKNSCL